MLVRDCMISTDAGVQTETPVGEVMRRMVQEDVLTLPVLDEHRHLLGSVSATDVWSALSSPHAPAELLCAGALGRTRPPSLGAEDSLESAASVLLATPAADALPVLEGDEVVGILTRHRLLETLAHIPPARPASAACRDTQAATQAAQDWGWGQGVTDPSIFVG